MKLLTEVGDAKDSSGNSPACSQIWAASYAPDGPAPAPGNPDNLYASFKYAAAIT